MMLQPARTNEDIARFQPETAPAEQEKPWERMKSEPARWFLRFQIYRNLGSKRSLRATIAAEQEAQPATKGNRKPRTTEKLSDVSVPGSWSRAAKVWNWQERAAAWDLDQLHRQGKRFQRAVGDCEFASRVIRIQCLNSLILSFTDVVQEMTMLEKQIEVTKLLQSLIKQIADETSLFDGMDTTELDGRVARYLSEHAEERRQKQEARQEAELDRLLAKSQQLQAMTARRGKR